jgi:transposase
MSKTRDFDALQKRRMRAANLLRRGFSQAQVAAKLGVSRQSLSRWAATVEAEGPTGLRKAGRAGRRPGLDEAQRRKLVEALKDGALVAGYGTDLWTLKRVGRLIEEDTGLRYSESGVWHVLANLGFSCQRPVGRALERDEARIEQWKRKRWPTLKKTPRPEGRR